MSWWLHWSVVSQAVFIFMNRRLCKTVIGKRKSPFNYMKKLKRVYCLIQTQSQGMKACFCHYNNNVYVVSDEEEMMNAEDVEDEVADDEQPSGSTRRDQSHSLLGESSFVCNWLLDYDAGCQEPKLHVLLKIYFNLLETNAKLVLFKVTSRRVGCALVLKMESDAGNLFCWSSSPIIRNAGQNSVYKVNLDFASALLFSGNNYYKIRLFCRRVHFTQHLLCILMALSLSCYFWILHNEDG